MQDELKTHITRVQITYKYTRLVSKMLTRYWDPLTDHLFCPTLRPRLAVVTCHQVCAYLRTQRM